MGYSFSKELDVEALLDSEEFPYAVGVWQPRIRFVSRDAFVVTDRRKRIVERVAGILTSLIDEVYLGDVEYGEERDVKYRLVLYHRSFLDFLRAYTQNNTCVPNFAMNFPQKRRNYIRAFFDSRGCVTSCPYQPARACRKVRFPRVIVTKKNSRSLLGSFSDLLRSEGIYSVVNGSTLRIDRTESVGTIVDKRLITDEQKAEKLKRIYDGFREYKMLCGLRRKR